MYESTLPLDVHSLRASGRASGQRREQEQLEEKHDGHGEKHRSRKKGPHLHDLCQRDFDMPELELPRGKRI